MKKKTIKLTIPEPCHEDWGNMTPNAKGKFCGSCLKPVIDFSKATDLEIIRFLDAHKGEKICGHFKASQLERPISKFEDPRTSAFSLRTVMFGATLTSMLGLESCRSEEVIMGDIAPVEQTQPTDQTNNNGTEVEGVMKMGEVAAEEYDHSNEKLMSGIITGSTNAKVAHALLTLYDENEKEIGKTYSKDDGSFRLELNWTKKPTYVVITADGLAQHYISIRSTEVIQEMKIVMYAEEQMIDGGLMIIEED